MPHGSGTNTRASRGYTVGEMLAKADETRKLYAGMIGAGEDEIAFLSSTTDFEKSRLLTEDDVVAFLDKWKPQRTSAPASSH